MAGMVDNEYDADVVIAGGALTGMWAGIRAKELDPSARVYVVDKATAGKSGCVAFAGGDITYVTPEDDLAALIDRYAKNGDGLAENAWIELALVETYDRVQEMAGWGVPFERDKDGGLKRYGGRGGGALAVVMPGYKLMDHMRLIAEDKGVKFIDRVMIVDILKDENGAVSGAWGYNAQRDETLLFKTPSVVVSSGPCTFKGSFIGHRMVTGDGVATAYRHGAKLTGMEFAVGHNTGPRDYDISGLARFTAMGGKFTNALGEAFMEKYDPVLKNNTNWGTLAYAMAVEVREGRGPVYFDLMAMSREHLELSRRIIPHTFKTLDRAGIDISKQRVEWIPCFQGSLACAAGIDITKDFATDIPGLFAAGDAGARRWYGANAGYHGINLAWSCVSGYHSGESAVRFSRGSDLKPINKSDLKSSMRSILEPLKRRSGMDSKDGTVKIQKILFSPDVAIIKNRETLRDAVEKLAALKGEIHHTIFAADGHELIKTVETRNMAVLAELIVRGALLREESRGCHFRGDYPEKDDSRFKHWSYLQQGHKGEIKLWLGALA
jgi:succinate dehydrogenase/fumarate reductase flavoprotein subunit